MYEVVFDEDFLGGLQLRCSSTRAYYLPQSCILNITYGKTRKDMYQQQKKWEGKSDSHNSYATAVCSDGKGYPQNHSYYIGLPLKDSSYGTRSMEYVEKPSKTKKQIKNSNQQSKPTQILSRSKRSCSSGITSSAGTTTAGTTATGK